MRTAAAQPGSDAAPNAVLGGVIVERGQGFCLVERGLLGSYLVVVDKPGLLRARKRHPFLVAYTLRELRLLAPIVERGDEMVRGLEILHALKRVGGWLMEVRQGDSLTPLGKTMQAAREREALLDRPQLRLL